MDIVKYSLEVPNRVLYGVKRGELTVFASGTLKPKGRMKNEEVFTEVARDQPNGHYNKPSD